MKPSKLIGTFAALAVASGCATTTHYPTRTITPDLRVGSLAAMTSFEQEVQASAPLPSDSKKAKAQRSRKAAFWTGIALIAVGAVGTVGFAGAGRGIQNRIDDGYDDGSLTRDDENSLADTGELMNALAITSASIGVAGIIIATVAYGLDYTRCGTLAKRRKDCKR